MDFNLEKRPLPPKLAQAFEGHTVELCEVPWLGVIEAWRAGNERGGLASQGLLAACLFVDGQPIGLDQLLAMPGRYTRVLGEAMAIVHQMHGLQRDDDDDESDAAPKP